MNDLGTALRGLDVEWPPTPDLAAVVTARIVAASGAAAGGAEATRGAAGGEAAGGATASGATASGAARLRGRWRPAWRTRLAALAAALALVAGGTLAASPAARSAVLRWLGLESVEIRRGTPRPAAGAGLGLGRPLAAVPPGTLVPAVLGAPDTAYDTTLPDGTEAVSLVYRGPPPVLVQVFRARATPFIEKTLPQATSAQRLRIDGAPAYWITGAHGFAYQADHGFGYEQQRLADRTLLVERDGLLIRVEGRLTKARAVAIARSLGD